MIIKTLRKYIPSESPIRKTWRWFKARLKKQSSPDQEFLGTFSRLFPEAFFVQIGSNDGVQLDPLRAQLKKNHWRGVMIEALPHIFNELVKNCAEYADRVTFMNVAIAKTDGVQPFYYLRPMAEHEKASMPEFYDMLGSFNRQVILSHSPYIPDIEDRLETLEIDALSFDSLCKKLSIQGIDLLHIDAEGYDFEILKNIDFSQHRPRVLIFEHHHLTNEDKKNCYQMIADAGFQLFPYGMDTWCLRFDGLAKKQIKSLSKAWGHFQAKANPGRS